MKSELQTGQKLLALASLKFTQPAASSRSCGDDFWKDCLHTISQPLTILLGSLELALLWQHRPDEYVVERLEEALEQTQRLIHWSRSVADMVSAENLEGFAGDVSLSAVLDEIIEGMRPLAGTLGLNLIGQCKENLHIHANPLSVSKAVQNVIDNAIKYSPEGSAVRVSLFRSNGNACIAISDEGPGLSPEERQHLFEPFFRGQKAKRKFEGAGLGLAIAKRIVDAHGGAIEVESLDGLGTCFRILLPLGSS